IRASTSALSTVNANKLIARNVCIALSFRLTIRVCHLEINDALIRMDTAEWPAEWPGLDERSDGRPGFTGSLELGNNFTINNYHVLKTALPEPPCVTLFSQGKPHVQSIECFSSPIPGNCRGKRFADASDAATGSRGSGSRESRRSSKMLRRAVRRVW